MATRNNPYSKKAARKVLRKRKDSKKQKALARKILNCSMCKQKAVTRGLCHKHYSSVMHDIARGRKSEKSLIKRGILLPGKGITKGRDDKMFLKGQKTRGYAVRAGECLVRKCKKPIRNNRGLCITHHSYAWDLIRKSKASEEDLIKRRLMRAKGAKISKKLKKKRPAKKVSKKTSKKKKKKVPAKRAKKKRSSRRKKKKSVVKPWTSESKPEKYKYCHVKGCRIQEELRKGLCKKHYMQMKRNKSASEADLVKRGLLLKPRTTQGYRKREFDILKKGSNATGKKLSGRCTLHRCMRRSKYRGMCKKHYLYTRTLIRRGEATEKDLISRNLMLPKTTDSQIFSPTSKVRGSIHRW